MKIPSNILEKWNEMKTQGDITEMAKGNRTKRVSLSRALKTGRCTHDEFITLRDFFKQREELIASVME